MLNITKCLYVGKPSVCVIHVLEMNPILTEYKQPGISAEEVMSFGKSTMDI